MRALVKEAPGPGLVLKEVEVPRPGENDAILAVKAAGICGTDVPIYDGVRQVPLPLVPGHEFAGIVVETGPGVSRFRPGDRATARLVIGCGTCEYCREGEETLCDNISEIGIHRDGAFAEYVRVPEGNLHLLPQKLSFEDGASVDPLASAYRAVKKAALKSGEAVAVFGPGPIGLYAVQVARAMGAGKVIMVGTRDDRLDKARELGADYAVNIRREDAVAKIREITNGRMVDVTIEATGSTEVVPAVLDATRKGGMVSLAGIFHDTFPVSPAPVVRKELNLLGSFCYTRQDFAESLELISTGKINPGAIITHRLPLGNGIEGWRLMKERTALKVIINP